LFIVLSLLYKTRPREKGNEIKVSIRRTFDKMKPHKKIYGCKSVRKPGFMGSFFETGCSLDFVSANNAVKAIHFA